MTFLHARLRALGTAGVLGRTGGLPRAALVVMFLHELAYQPLAPPVQFPFEFALAHLSGFAGGEEGFGIREDSIGRRARVSAAGAAGSRLLHVDCTSLESCLHSHRRHPPSQDTVSERRANVQKGARPRGTGACRRRDRVAALGRKEADGTLAGRCRPSNRNEEGISSDINPYE